MVWTCTHEGFARDSYPGTHFKIMLLGNKDHLTWFPIPQTSAPMALTDEYLIWLGAIPA